MTTYRSIKSQSFKQWELAQLARHEPVNMSSEHYNPRVKSQSSKQWELAQLARHEPVNMRSEHYNPRVKDSIPVRGNFFACSNTILAELPE